MLGHVTFVNILIKFKEKLQVNSTPAKIYFFKFYNRSTSKRCNKCSELTIKTSKGRLFETFS